MRVGVYSRYSRCWLLRTYFDVMPVPIFDAEKDSLLTHLEVKTTAGPAPKGSHLSQPDARCDAGDTHVCIRSQAAVMICSGEKSLLGSTARSRSKSDVSASALGAAERDRGRPMIGAAGLTVVPDASNFDEARPSSYCGQGGMSSARCL